MHGGAARGARRAGDGAAVDAPGDDALRLAPAGLLPARLPIDGGERWRLRTAVAAFDAADAVPVRDFSGSWDRYSPRAGRNAAIEMLQAEVSASRRHWEVALVARSEIVIDGSRGAWDAVRADKQRQAPPAGTRLDADVAGRGIGWVGLRGARSWSFGGPQGTLPSAGRWQFTLAATLMSVRRVQTLAASGRVDFDGRRYAFDAAGTRRDSYREFADYGTPRTLGVGVGADLGIAWQPTARSFVNLSVVDALSALRVDGVATQDAAVSSSTATTGADGYVDYRPLLAGRYSSQSLRTSLPRKFSLNGGLAFDPPWGGRAALAGLRLEQVCGLDAAGCLGGAAAGRRRLAAARRRDALPLVRRRPGRTPRRRLPAHPLAAGRVVAHARLAAGAEPAAVGAAHAGLRALPLRPAPAASRRRS